MRKLSLLALSTILFACESNKPDYILNKTAFCSGIGSEKQEEVICKDSNSNLVSGRIIEYFDDGKIHRNFVVKAGKRNGYQKVYYENGLLRLEADYKDGKEDGLAKWYSENGKLMAEAHYKDGKLNGSHKEYYENGKLKMTCEFKDGKRNGYQEEYYENGKLRVKAYNEDDYQHGLTKVYYENGAIQLEANYKNGKLNGSQKEYYENGNLKLEALLKDGKEDGYQKSYDKNGFLYQESQWKNGKKISETPKEKIKQANYEKCTKNIKLCSANHYDKDCLENLGGWWNNKITSITTEGVLVTFVLRDFFGQSATDRVFIYTKHEYLSGYSINKDYYYQYVGVYEYTSTLGTLERVKAFKETNIPVCDQFH